MIDSSDKLIKEIEAVRQIPIVPTMLEVICQTTGMGFAAIARVTEDLWIACSVRDKVNFGLQEGGELQIKTTLCNEIRDHRKPIIIDHVNEDQCYKHHHTPKLYGLQSYISFPIILKDGRFFGTLCAIDANPAKLNNSKMIGMFTLFTDLLAFHLQSLDLLEESYKATQELQQKNNRLTSANTELDTIVYTAAHDLKSPIINIEGLLNILFNTVSEENIDREKVAQLIELLKTSFNRFGRTIKDLTTFVEAENATMDGKPEEINIGTVVETVKEELTHLIKESNAKIEVMGENTFETGLPIKNFKSILYNLLSNALKYRSPDRLPEIEVKVEMVEGYIHLSVTDNGLGIPADKLEKVFTVFKRFHTHVEGTGLGLYIVKRMVEQANGHIEVKSTLNQGTTFTLIL